jgi:hypothetical protein
MSRHRPKEVLGRRKKEGGCITFRKKFHSFGDKERLTSRGIEKIGASKPGCSLRMKPKSMWKNLNSQQRQEKEEEKQAERRATHILSSLIIMLSWCLSLMPNTQQPI